VARARPASPLRAVRGDRCKQQRFRPGQWNRGGCSVRLTERFHPPRGLCANPPDWSSGTSRRERRAPQSSEGRRSRKGVGGPIPWFITNGGGPADSPFHGVAGTRIRRRVPASQLGKDVHAPSPPWGFPTGKTRGTGGPTGRACLTKRPLTNLHHDLPRARLERGCRFIAPGLPGPSEGHRKRVGDRNIGPRRAPITNRLPGCARETGVTGIYDTADASHCSFRNSPGGRGVRPRIFSGETRKEGLWTPIWRFCTFRC
jgi:hypothetical protein